MNQQILFTTLPNGYSKTSPKKLNISVFVSPRLDPQAQPNALSTFPDFTMWPKTVLNQLGFHVEVTGVPGSKPATRVSADPRPAVWAALFPPDTLVQPFVYSDYRGRIVRTFQVRNIVLHLRDVYRDIAQNSAGTLPAAPYYPNGNPALEALTNSLGPILSDVDHGWDKQVTSGLTKHALKTFDPAISIQDVRLMGFQDRAQFDFFLTHRFYARPENQNAYSKHPDLAKVPPRVQKPTIDFHQALGAFSDHPQLLRDLGIIIDLEIDPPALLSSMIRVIPIWNSGKPPEVTPWTHYDLSTSDFLAKPKGPSLKNHRLDLRNASDNPPLSMQMSQYDIVQIDPDGSALKAVNFAASMANLRWQPFTYTQPKGVGLPAIRSAGLALSHHGRGLSLTQHFADAFQLNQRVNNAQTPPDFFAEDLLRGWRVDVLDLDAPKAQWRSLCQRAGTYAITRPLAPALNYSPDEGYIKDGSTTSADAAASDLYFHEVMFKWLGWSMVAPRPGKTIRADRPDGTLQQTEEIEDLPKDPATNYGLSVSFKPVDHSLPKLRFGHRYLFRVRAADLAGNGEPPGAPDRDSATDQVPYLRYEPVDVPVLLPMAVFTEGESLETMVIRSNYDSSAKDYIAGAAVVSALKGKPHTYLASNFRHVAPPKTSQLMAETHGMFDPLTPEQGFRIALKEEGTFRDTDIVDIATGKKTIPVTGMVVYDPPGAKPPDQGGDHPAGRYIIHTEDKLLLPYLPDPIARGAAFRFLPGVTDPARKAAGPGGKIDVQIVSAMDAHDVLQVAFHTDWPKSQPFRIEIQERPGKMEGDKCQEIFSDKGEWAWDGDRRILTVFLRKGEAARVRYSCFPDRGDIDLLGIFRWLLGAANLPSLRDLASTGCHWMVSPYRVLTLVHAVQQPLCAPSLDKAGVSRLLGATNARLFGHVNMSVRSTGQLDFMAKWHEPVDPLNEPSWKTIQGQGRVTEMPVLETFSDFQNLEPLRVIHEFGDTKYRRVDYYLTGTTRFREFFPPEITQDPANITRTGPVATLDVPSTARPAAPKVLYVVPTFGWKRSRESGVILSRRIGGGLRVYLDRPWFSSGDGELLGVVLRKGNESESDIQRLTPYVTQWGKDPVFGSANPKNLPQLSDFPANTGEGAAQAPSLQLREVPLPVAVSGHPVHFDMDRRLWYADIQVTAGASYFPFVRLAVARYQPHSLEQAEMSPVILTDFAQLFPDRLVRLAIDKGKRNVTVTIMGVAPVATGVSKELETDPVPAGIPGAGRPAPPPSGLNEFDIVVETVDPAIDSDLGWQVVPDAVTAQNLQVNPTGPPFQDMLLWSRAVHLPDSIDVRQYRLVIREYELYYMDDQDAFLQKSIARRVVYADVIDLFEGPDPGRSQALGVIPS